MEDKEDYEAPAIVVLGTIADLTLAHGVGDEVDTAFASVGS
jgi:hypothetical protein